MNENLNPWPTWLASISMPPALEFSAPAGVAASRIRPTAAKLSAFLGLVLLLATPLHAEEQTDPARKLLGLTEEFSAQLETAARHGLIEIAPVNLPLNPPGDCNHYGWPIATRVGDTMIVMHRRIPGHKASGAGRPHEKMSYGIVLRSEDRGATWSRPYDLRDCMKPVMRGNRCVCPVDSRHGSN